MAVPSASTRTASVRSWVIAFSVLFSFTLMACSPPWDKPSQTATPSPTGPSAAPSTPIAAPSSPAPTIARADLSVAQAQDTAQRFLQGWERGDYAGMYGLLSEGARAAIGQDRFVTRYRAIMSGVAVTKVTTTLGQGQAFSSGGAQSAKVPFTVTLTSARFGDLVERNDVSLVAESGAWRVAWTPELIFHDLTADNFVRVDPQEPPRGSITDRKGRLLAGPGNVVSIGLVPGNIKDEAQALKALADYTGIKADAIKSKYAGAKPDWWVPLLDLPVTRREEALAKLGTIAGVEVRNKEARVYPQGMIAAHIVGYVSPVNADDLAQHPNEGYEEGDFVGRTGIEQWAERQLGGQKGGRLLIADADGNTVRVIAQRKPQDGLTVQLTIDLDVQQQAEAALGEKNGSVVVLDPRGNAILAMVSHPAFDPNVFVTGLSDADWQRLSNDPRHPFQMRPTMSAYPTGSIFKVITMAAGLERGDYKPDTPFDCTGTWTGLPGVVLRDWLPEGHGKLTLQEGLTTSCNIVFYELGKKLDSIDSQILPDFARQFGLGQLTGLVGVPEMKGTVPDAQWKQQNLTQPWYPGDAVNLAIGQGYLEATPLQMANVYATLARNGELRTPALVARVGDKEYGSQPIRRVPASAATLRSIRDGMKDVASSPKGTAYYAFQGFKIPVAAKTGSAENTNPDAHAWFAAYAPAEAPEMVVIAMVEGGRAGGEVAAPIGRRIMDAYFKGR